MKFALPLLFCLLALRVSAAPEYPQMGPDIYDPKADAAADITRALESARTSQKHVLLIFGANWCPWCRSLHRLIETDATVAKVLRENYVVVLVDSNWRHGEKRNHEVNLRYGNPLKEGLPVFVVLDANGRQLTTQETGILEDGEAHSPIKVTAFLQKWAPKA